jgi:yeeE/yedE family protein
MEFFNRLSQNETYKKIMKTPLSYETGAILLGITATVYLAIFKSAWSVSGPFTVWGAKILWLIGIDTTKWSYFIAHPGLKRAIVLPIFKSGGSVCNTGIIIGAALATLFASEFKIKKIKGKRQLLGAVIGGFLMGLGARFASGCNISALFSALSALSLTGWFFGLSVFIGSFIGGKILLKYIIK